VRAQTELELPTGFGSVGAQTTVELARGLRCAQTAVELAVSFWSKFASPLVGTCCEIWVRWCPQCKAREWEAAKAWAAEGRSYTFLKFRDPHLAGGEQMNSPQSADFKLRLVISNRSDWHTKTRKQPLRKRQGPARPGGKQAENHAWTSGLESQRHQLVAFSQQKSHAHYSQLSNPALQPGTKEKKCFVSVSFCICIRLLYSFNLKLRRFLHSNLNLGPDAGRMGIW